MRGKMMYKWVKPLLISFCAAAVISCMGNDMDVPDFGDDEESSAQGRRVEFFTEIIDVDGADGSAFTKSSPCMAMEDYGSFRVYGYLFSGLWNAGNSSDILTGETVRYNGTGVWSTEGFYTDFLAGGRTLRCYAYAPSDACVTDISAQGPLSFAYTVSSDVASQTDLAAGVSTDATSLSALTVSFRHCLSAVTFRMEGETINGVVKSISLKGVYSSGRYTCSEGWSGVGTPADFSIVRDVALQEGTELDLTNGETTMMMIPQKVPDGAVLEIEVVDEDGLAHTLTTDGISGSLWEEGHTIKYAISFDSLSGVHISLDRSSDILEWGESKSFVVTTVPVSPFTYSISGAGSLSGTLDGNTITVTNNNVTLSDETGLLVAQATDDKCRRDTARILARHLAESLVLSPAELEVEYGGTESLAATGTYPQGFTVEVPDGTSLEATSYLSGVQIVKVSNNTESFRKDTVTLTATTVIQGARAQATLYLAPKPETISISPLNLTVASGDEGTFAIGGDFEDYTVSIDDGTVASVSSKGGKSLTVGNVNTSFEDRTTTVTVTTTGDTRASASASLTLSSLVDHVTGYEISDISLSASTVGAGGGSVSVKGGSVTQFWASGKTVADYAQASYSAGANSIVPGKKAEVSGDAVSIPSLGTDETSSVSTYTVTASYTDGKVAAEPKCATVCQSANSKALSSLALSASPSSVGASGGTATIKGTAGHIFSSGSTMSEEVTPQITSVGTNSANSAFQGTFSGAVVTIPSLGVTPADAGTYQVTGTYSSGGTVAESTCSISQSANSISSISYSIAPVSADSYGSSSSPCPASGGSAGISGGEGTITYIWTSGGTTGGSFTPDKSVGSYSLAGALSGTISGNTVSIPSLSDKETSSVGYYTVTYSYSGATSRTCRIYQAVNSASYGQWGSWGGWNYTGSSWNEYGSAYKGSKEYDSGYTNDGWYETSRSDTEWTLTGSGTEITNISADVTDKTGYYAAFARSSQSFSSDAGSEANAASAHHYEETYHTCDQQPYTDYSGSYIVYKKIDYYRSWKQYWYTPYTTYRKQYRTGSRQVSYSSGFSTTQYGSYSGGYGYETRDVGTGDGTDKGSVADSGRDYDHSDDDTASGTDSKREWGTKQTGVKVVTTASHKVDDSPVVSSSASSWLTWSSGVTYVSANTGTSDRSGKLTVTNGDASAVCDPVTQKGKPAVTVDHYEYEFTSSSVSSSQTSFYVLGGSATITPSFSARKRAVNSDSSYGSWSDCSSEISYGYSVSGTGFSLSGTSLSVGNNCYQSSSRSGKVTCNASVGSGSWKKTSSASVSLTQDGLGVSVDNSIYFSSNNLNCFPDMEDFPLYVKLGSRVLTIDDVDENTGYTFSSSDSWSSTAFAWDLSGDDSDNMLTSTLEFCVKVEYVLVSQSTGTVQKKSVSSRVNLECDHDGHGIVDDITYSRTGASIDVRGDGWYSSGVYYVKTGVSIEITND